MAILRLIFFIYMRLTSQQIIQIRQAVVQESHQNTDIYLFGSRLDENKKGGDVDLLLKTKMPLPLKTIAMLKIQLESQLMLPVDIVNYYEQQSSTFVQLACAQAVKI